MIKVALTAMGVYWMLFFQALTFEASVIAMAFGMAVYFLIGPYWQTNSWKRFSNV